MYTTRMLQIVELVQSMCPSGRVQFNTKLLPASSFSPSKVEIYLNFADQTKTSFIIDEADKMKDVLKLASMEINRWISSCIRELVDCPKWYWDIEHTWIFVNVGVDGKRIDLEYMNDNMVDLRLIVENYNTDMNIGIANLITSTIAKSKN